MIRLRNVSSLSALLIRSLEMLMRSSRWSWIRTGGTRCWVTRDMFRSDRTLWHVPWLIPGDAAILYTVWERVTRTNVATSWILSWILAVLGQQYAYHLPNCLSPVQNVCALRPKASSPYACLIIWNVSLADLPNLWQNLTSAHCSNCDILDFHSLQTTAHHNSNFLSEYTEHTQLLLAGMRRMDTAPSCGFTYPL
jgi:hypothetical protein